MSIPGQMINMPEKQQILFIGSPRLGCLEDMQTSNIYMSDIPIHDSSRELILLSQRRATDIQVRYWTPMGISHTYIYIYIYIRVGNRLFFLVNRLTGY